MKAGRLFVVAAVLIAGGMAVTLYSSEGQDSVQGAGQPGLKGKGADPAVYIDKQVERLTKQLNLTQEQQAKVKDILKAQRRK